MNGEWTDAIDLEANLLSSPSKQKPKKYLNVIISVLSNLKSLACSSRDCIELLGLVLTAFIISALIICTTVTVGITLFHHDIELILSIDHIPKHIFSTTKRANSLPLYPCSDAQWLYVEYDNHKMKEFLSKQFENEIAQIDESLKDIVEQADLWRYSVINEHGGLYMDSDTACRQPVDGWLHSFDLETISLHKDNSYILNNLLRETTVPLSTLIDYPKNNKIEIDMVVGIEFNEMDDRFNNFNSSSLQFVQWTFLSRPHNKILQSVIDTVLDNLKSIEDIKENVISRTGPRAFTDGILKFIQKYSLYQEDLPLFDYQQIDASGQLIPMQCDGEVLWILILPYRAFGYYGGHPPQIAEVPVSQRLITHSFEGSWK